MKINRIRKAGFTLVEIMIVVAIIALLAAIAIPNFVKARTSSQKTACIANLKQIDGAKATWAMEMKKSSSATPVNTELYGATLYIREQPGCRHATLAEADDRDDAAGAAPIVWDQPASLLDHRTLRVASAIIALNTPRM